MSTAVNKIKASSSEKLFVRTFYYYRCLEEKPLRRLAQTLLKKGARLNVRGLILLSKEGINATITGEKTPLTKYLKIIEGCVGFSIQSQLHTADSWGFKALRVKIKKEIARSGKEDLTIPCADTRLDPKKWESALKRNTHLVLDIRNNYEVELGRFKNAKDLNLKEFKQFPEKLKKSNFPKDKNILIYCTGGIRCEKALSEMKNQGFQSVRQLKGGILNYLKSFPHSNFNGECFVFDHRVSVNQNLEPSGTYKLCPHCGQPGKKQIICRHCDGECVVCALCFAKNNFYQTCSKNCAYHYKNNHQCKIKKNHSLRPDSHK